MIRTIKNYRGAKEMSESEYESEYDSEYDSDSEYTTDSEATGATGATELTCTSLEAALAEMTNRLAELDEGLTAMATTTKILEQPMAAVAISAFKNPRVLESAPFRATKFRLRPAAKTFLRTPHHTVTFAELCAAIREAIECKKQKVEAMWGTSDFLGILQRLPDIIV